MSPPDGTVRMRVSVSPSCETANDVTSSLPALTAYSRSPCRAIAPWLPSPAPVPVPPVENFDGEDRVPSEARGNTRTAFPLVRFVKTYTAPVAFAADAPLVATPRNDRTRLLPRIAASTRLRVAFFM